MKKAIEKDTVFTAVWAAEPDPPKIIWLDEGDGSGEKSAGVRPVDLIRVYDGTAYHNPIELRTSGGADYGGSGASDPMPADGLLWTTDGRYFVAPFHRETQAQDGITIAADDDPDYYAFGLPSRTNVAASGKLALAFVVMSRDANIYGSEERKGI